MAEFVLGTNELGNQYVDDKDIIWQITNISNKNIINPNIGCINGSMTSQPVFEISTLNGITKTHCSTNGLFLTYHDKYDENLKPDGHYYRGNGRLVKKLDVYTEQATINKGSTYSEEIRKKYNLSIAAELESKKFKYENQLRSLIERKATQAITKFSIHFINPCKSPSFFNAPIMDIDAHEIIINFLKKERFYFEKWANHIVIDLLEEPK